MRLWRKTDDPKTNHPSCGECEERVEAVVRFVYEQTNLCKKCLVRAMTLLDSGDDGDYDPDDPDGQI